MKPPHTPTITKARASNGRAKRPSVAVRVPKNPITNEPSTLMAMVPHGKAGPVSTARTVPSQARPTLPSAPPSATSA